MPATATEPALGRAFRKARAVMTGNTKEHEAKKLADALSELKRLQNRRLQLQGELDRRVDISYFVRAEREAAAKYEQSLSPEDLRALILCELITERARQKTAVVDKLRQYGHEDVQWRQEFPEFRAALLKVAEQKLQIARSEFSRIRSEEVQRLSGQGFDDEQIDKSPLVSRARGVVQGWEFRLKKIETDPVELCFKENVEAVLEDE